MSGIEELRQRVQDAEEHFGLAREEQAKYSERLIGLIDTVEGRLRDQQAEIDRLQAIAVSHDEALAKEQAQIGRFERENEHLREMLHSLLRAIESGGRSGVVEIMQTLDQKVSALIAGDAAPAAEAAPAPEMETVAPEPVEEAAAEPVAEAAPEPEMEAELPEPVEDAAAEVMPEPEPETEALSPEPVEEAVVEPVVEAIAEPETAAMPESAEEAAAEPVAEATPEPAEESTAEAAVEPEAELAAAMADDHAAVAALEEIASQLAAPSAGDSAAVSDSLHEIMDRVSRLVRDSEDAEAEAASAATPPEKKSAAG